MLSVFVSGLDAQCGKTLLTAGLAATMQSLSYSTGVYKPIITNSNNNFQQSLTGENLIKHVDSNIVTKYAYNLSSGVTPFVGAYQDGIKIDVNSIYTEFRNFANTLDCCFVEGSNSISTPISQSFSELDFVKAMNIPLLLLVNPNVTSIEHVLAGLKFASSSGVKVLGLVINQYDENSDKLEIKYFPQIIKEFSPVKILGCLPDYGDISQLLPEVLICDILNKISIEEIFNIKIAKLG